MAGTCFLPKLTLLVRGTLMTETLVGIDLGFGQCSLASLGIEIGIGSRSSLG